MNKEKVVTKESYKQIVLKRMIILCWIFLFICFAIKIFGGNFFVFLGKSKVTEYIANHLWLFIIVQFVFYLLQSFLYFGIVFKNEKIWLIVLLTAIGYASKLLTVIFKLNIIYSFIIEFIILIVIPIIINKKEWYIPLIINILLIIFQIISMITKNIIPIEFPYFDIVGYIYMLDYYIMLGLTYLYFYKGGFNMTLGFWFLSKDKAQLEAYKEIVNKKHEKKIAKIDAKIAKAK